MTMPNDHIVVSIDPAAEALFQMVVEGTWSPAPSSPAPPDSIDSENCRCGVESRSWEVDELLDSIQDMRERQMLEPALKQLETNQTQIFEEAKVFGGRRVRDMEMPWFGAFARRNGKLRDFICGSSLIASSWALSAAHCTRVTNGVPKY